MYIHPFSTTGIIRHTYIRTYVHTLCTYLLFLLATAARVGVAVANPALQAMPPGIPTAAISAQQVRVFISAGIG